MQILPQAANHQNEEVKLAQIIVEKPQFQHKNIHQAAEPAGLAVVWEDFDITGETSEMASGVPRSSPRHNETFDQIVGFHPKDGVHLSVSRSVFRSAKRKAGAPVRFIEQREGTGVLENGRAFLVSKYQHSTCSIF